MRPGIRVFSIGLVSTLQMVTFSCHEMRYEKPKVVQKEQTKVQENQKVEKANSIVNDVAMSLNMLAAVATPIEKEVEKNNTTTLVTAKYDNAFSMAAEMFSDVGVGELSASSNNSKYSVSFKSVKAEKIIGNTNTVELNVSIDENTNENIVNLVIKQSGKNEMFKIFYNNGVTNIKGTGNSYTLNFSNLNDFYYGVAKLGVETDDSNLSGIVVLTDLGHTLELSASKLVWKNVNHAIVVNKFDLSFQKDDLSIQDIAIEAESSRRSDDALTGFLKIEYDDAAADDSKFSIIFDAVL